MSSTAIGWVGPRPQRGEPAPNSHRMDEGEATSHPARARSSDAGILGDVARHDFDSGSGAVLEHLGPAGEASDMMTGDFESGQEPATDVAGGARQEDAAEGLTM